MRVTLPTSLRKVRVVFGIAAGVLTAAALASQAARAQSAETYAAKPYPQASAYAMMEMSQLEPAYGYERLAFQPPSASPSPATAAPGATAAAGTGAGAQSAVLGLASVPNMYGDFFSTNCFCFWSCPLWAEGAACFPQLGYTKISENNSALPQDRWYFNYQHYHNALSGNISPGSGLLQNRSLDLDRYTVGFEKAFLDGLWSVELRMPFFGSSGAVFDEGFAFSNGRAGNLAVINKLLLYESETSAFAAGVGTSLPTGTESRLTVAEDLFTIHNDAVHIQPFLGMLISPGGRAFYQAMAQLDIPVQGNNVTVQADGQAFRPELVGVLNNPTYLYLDASVGYWLFHRPGTGAFTGLAMIAEAHYTASLSDADVIDGATSDTQFRFRPVRNRLKMVTATMGLHAELFDRTALRGAVVMPLTNEENRFFDTEIWFSINHRF